MTPDPTPDAPVVPTLTLTDFLLARITEDRASIPWNDESWWQPERYAAECEAKQRIVERHASSGVGGCYICQEFARDAIDCVEQRILGTVYADHPDYREEWRP